MRAAEKCTCRLHQRCGSLTAPCIVRVQPWSMRSTAASGKRCAWSAASMSPGQQWTQPSSAFSTLLAVHALHASRRARSPSLGRSLSGRASGDCAETSACAFRESFKRTRLPRAQAAAVRLRSSPLCRAQGNRHRPNATHATCMQQCPLLRTGGCCPEWRPFRAWRRGRPWPRTSAGCCAAPWSTARSCCWSCPPRRPSSARTPSSGAAWLASRCLAGRLSFWSPVVKAGGGTLRISGSAVSAVEGQPQCLWVDKHGGHTLPSLGG